MVCEHCGSQLDIDMIYCPYCGKENTEAKQHQNDMKEYDTQFQETRTEVIKKARKFSRYYGQTIMIVTLVLAILFAIIMHEESYAVEENKQQKYFIQNKSQVLDTLNKYCEEGDYYALYQYLVVNFDQFNVDELKAYNTIGRTAENLNKVSYHIFAYIHMTDDTSYSNALGNAARELKYFYDTVEGRSYYLDSYKNQYTEEAFNEMRAEMETFLKAYAGFSDEDIVKIKDMQNITEITTMLTRRLSDEE